MEPVPVRVVVAGVDGSPSSATAAAWAAEEARRRKCSLHLVSAYQPAVGYAGPGGVLPPSLFDGPRLVAEQDLARTVEMIRQLDPDLAVTVTASLQTPFGALREAASGAEMVVVGSHGQGVTSETLLGSVAQKLISRSAVPVVVIRTDPHAAPSVPPAPDAPVLVGLDGSHGSEAALGLAFEEARLRSTELVAVRCWDDAPLNGVLRSYPVEVDRADIDRAEEQELSAQLAPWREKDPSVPLRPLVMRGRATQVLLRVGEKLRPSVLVVGSRGRGGFTGLLLGSTSHEIVAYAGCPVIVVHAPAATTSEA